MIKERILGLFKFGSRDHMEELVREGHLYMRSLSEFVRMESDALRADENEGLAHTIPADGWTLSVAKDGDDRWEPVGTIEGALRYSDSNLRRAHVFCMHAILGSNITTFNDTRFIDPRNLEFGDTFVLFTDGNEFLRRVEAEVIRLNLRARSRLVEYIDFSSYRGPMGIFRKDVAFRYQNEYRLALLPGAGEAYSLRVGDLSDIAIMDSVSSIYERVRIINSGHAGSPNTAAPADQKAPLPGR